MLAASGTISAAAAARISTVVSQPWRSIRDWLSGTTSIWPAVAPAVTMPSHMLRLPSGATRPTIDSSSGKLQPETPSPIRKPALSRISIGVTD